MTPSHERGSSHDSLSRAAQQIGAGEVVTGNLYDKFRTRNPLARYLQAGFLRACRELLDVPSTGRAPGRVLEVGCGPGDLAEALFTQGTAPESYAGIDIGLQEARTANRQYPERSHFVASAYELPFPAKSFDLVLCCEVLEHLEHPREALREIDRVAAGRVLVSVPWEPVWRLMNIARGAYLSALGNTPGHLQNYSRARIRQLVGDNLEIVAERRPLPWTILLAQSRHRGNRG